MDKDKRKQKKSKEEIAKEFDLPERKSKIATIMKQDGQVYCICRSSDGSRFMIGCDNCEEWYHGDCINITEKDSRYIKQYYCQRCRQDDSSLQIVFRVFAADSGGEGGSEKRKKHNKDTGGHSQASGSSASGVASTGNSSAVGNNSSKQGGRAGKRRCGVCDPCRRPNCNKCEACLQRSSGHRSRCLERVCINKIQKSSNGVLSNTNGVLTNNNTSTTTTTTTGTTSGSGRRKAKPIKKERSRKRNRSVTPEIFINPELDGKRQCFGPSCLNNSRPQSKYCSDNCGIKLASSRIFHMLMPRLQERNLTPCRAATENKKQLDEIRRKQGVIHITLDELDKRQLELDRIVALNKNSTIDPKRLNDNSDVEDEQSMYCITCGHEIHSRTAIKHMEKCFNKYESQASFGSIFKTRVEGNSMFCDFYNPASKTYCKRLRVLCPEHCKDPKVSDTDVCGGPILDDNFQPTGEYCRAPKKICFRHFAWEKMRRAEIDLERVRQWLKLDELVEQERQVRNQMASRAGLLGLMLHSTYDHEVLEELVKQQQQHIAEMQKNNQMNYHRKKVSATAAATTTTTQKALTAQASLSKKKGTNAKATTFPVTKHIVATDDESDADNHDVATPVNGKAANHVVTSPVVGNDVANHVVTSPVGGNVANHVMATPDGGDVANHVAGAPLSFKFTNLIATKVNKNVVATAPAAKKGLLLAPVVYVPTPVTSKIVAPDGTNHIPIIPTTVQCVNRITHPARFSSVPYPRCPSSTATNNATVTATNSATIKQQTIYYTKKGTSASNSKPQYIKDGKYMVSFLNKANSDDSCSPPPPKKSL